VIQELTLDLVRRFPTNGPTDPIAYYARPLTGYMYRERINQGLRLLPDRRYERCLEVGFGSGAVQVALSRISGELHGIDLDADPAVTLDVLRTFGVAAELRRANVYELPYPDEHFDLAASFSVFEHLAEFGRGLAEVRRVLRPRGAFLLGMPAVNRMMEAGFLAIGFKGINDHHVTTPQQVEESFSRSGFRVVGAARLTLPVPLPRMPGLPVYYNWLLERA
jgi:ubiquinone/menaquinone biosynthesis C-methylase UbiE